MPKDEQTDDESEPTEEVVEQPKTQKTPTDPYDSFMTAFTGQSTTSVEANVSMGAMAGNDPYSNFMDAVVGSPSKSTKKAAAITEKDTEKKPARKKDEYENFVENLVGPDLAKKV